MRSFLVPGLFVAALLSVAACGDDDDGGDGTGASGSTGNPSSSSTGSGDGGSGATGGSPAGTGGSSDGGASVGGNGGAANGGAGVGGSGGAGQGGAGGRLDAFGDECTPDPDTCPAPLVCFGFGMQKDNFHCTLACDTPADCAPYTNVCNNSGYCKAN